MSYKEIVQWLKLYFSNVRLTLSIDHEFTVRFVQHLWSQASVQINLKFTGEIDALFEEQMHEAYKNTVENITDFMEEEMVGHEYQEKHITSGSIIQFSINILQ